MKKLLTTFLFIFLFFSCGGIKDLNYGEPFTIEEKKLFSDIFDRYINEDNNNNKQLQITKSIGDNLILIEGYYNPPFYPSRYQYKFTKENGKFICRSYKNNEIQARDEDTNFNKLLLRVLKL